MAIRSLCDTYKEMKGKMLNTFSIFLRKSLLIEFFLKISKNLKISCRSNFLKNHPLLIANLWN